jgi:hypothetical protein
MVQRVQKKRISTKVAAASCDGQIFSWIQAISVNHEIPIRGISARPKIKGEITDKWKKLFRKQNKMFDQGQYVPHCKLSITDVHFRSLGSVSPAKEFRERSHFDVVDFFRIEPRRKAGDNDVELLLLDNLSC